MEESIYDIKGNAGHKSAMSRKYTALAHNIICVSLCERLKLSQECSDSNCTAGGKIQCKYSATVSEVSVLYTDRQIDLNTQHLGNPN